MASEYLLKKYKDVKPDEPKQMTEKEKRANWWYYHRIHICIGAAVLLLLASFVWEMASKIEPDYQIAYVGKYALGDDVTEKLEARLTELGLDRNGDGRVVVQINSYVMNEEDPTAYATQISLAADISVGNSSFFLLEDPVSFQADYGILTMEDGSVFDDGMDPAGCVHQKLEDCAALSDLETGQTVYLCQRAFGSDDNENDRACLDSLWRAVVTGFAQ